MSKTSIVSQTDTFTPEETGRLITVKNKFEKVVKNRLESIEPIDRIGFEEDDDTRFDATSGSINNFNPKPTVEVPQYLRRDFENDDASKLNPDSSPITELFQNGAEVTFGALQKSADFLGDAFGEAKGALSELVQTVSGKTEVPQAFHKAFEGEDPSKLDPTKIAKEQKDKEIMIARENANTVLENEARQASREDYEKMIEMALRLGVNVESLADKLDAPHLRKADLLRVYYIALGATEQEAEQKVASKIGGFNGGAFKQGGQGLNGDAAHNDLLSNETKATAQQNVG